MALRTKRDNCQRALTALSGTKQAFESAVMAPRHFAGGAAVCCFLSAVARNLSPLIVQASFKGSRFVCLFVRFRRLNPSVGGRRELPSVLLDENTLGEILPQWSPRLTQRADPTDYAARTFWWVHRHLQRQGISNNVSWPLLLSTGWDCQVAVSSSPRSPSTSPFPSFSSALRRERGEAASSYSRCDRISTKFTEYPLTLGLVYTFEHLQGIR